MSTVSPDLSEKRRAAARRRWGPPRTVTVRLDTLGPSERRIITALLDAAAAAAARPAEPSAGQS